jgi:hypothetical protein
MLLFDHADRPHPGPADHVEDTYSFLCRSAWQASARARGLLEAWFAHYPPEHQQDLRRRFESSFAAAFFELAIHEVLRRIGARVSVHPEVPGADTRPDYLAAFPDGSEVLVEVVVAHDESAEAAAEAARRNQLWDEINKLTSPNFFLRIADFQLLTNEQPSGRRIRAFLKRELNKFDPDQVIAEAELGGPRALPTLPYRDPKVSIDFTLVPKSPEGRTRQLRPIGIYPMESRWGGSRLAIRNAVDRKATRYGLPHCPFVVALNCTSPWGSEKEDAVDALFGSEAVVLSLDNLAPTMRRNPDGAWFGPNGAQNTRVSAVLFGNLVLWGLHTSTFRLFLNPWAANPLAADSWRLPLARPVDGRLHWEEGSSPGEIYQLPDDWPGRKGDRAAT